MIQSTSACPCKSGATYEDCCQPFHAGSAPAPTAEKLMRSRYAAFALGLAEYIVGTQTSRELSTKALQDDLETTRWTNLIVLGSKSGGEGDETGQVTFVAAYRAAGASIDTSAAQIHERSSFEKIDGDWRYTSGEHLQPYKTGRNDPCWCGSGKKTKKCCG